MMKVLMVEGIVEVAEGMSVGGKLFILTKLPDCLVKC